MKNPLLRLVDPNDGLLAAETALRQTAERIQSLETERSTAIAEAGEDYAARVATLDRELSTLRANAEVHRERAAAMRERQHRAMVARREREKQAAIAEIQKRMMRRLAAAQELDSALKIAAEAFATLLAADDELFAKWPDVLPSAARFNYLRASILEPLSPRRTARPNAPGLGRQLLERLPFNFADDLQRMSDELINELASAPIDGMIDATGTAAGCYGQSAAVSQG